MKNIIDFGDEFHFNLLVGEVYVTGALFFVVLETALGLLLSCFMVSAILANKFDSFLIAYALLGGCQVVIIHLYFTEFSSSLTDSFDIVGKIMAGSLLLLLVVAIWPIVAVVGLSALFGNK